MSISRSPTWADLPLVHEGATQTWSTDIDNDEGFEFKFLCNGTCQPGSYLVVPAGAGEHVFRDIEPEMNRGPLPERGRHQATYFPSRQRDFEHDVRV